MPLTPRPLASRRTVPLVAAAAAAVLVAGTPAHSAPAPVTPAAPLPAPDGGVHAPVPTLDWRPCGPDLEPFLCATADVPTDYDAPTGPTTRLALTKLPASGPPEQRLGTLFTNPGGPGGSAVEFVQQAARTAYAPEVLARYDVVGVDPRGVGASDPATCFRSADAELASPLLALPAHPLPQRHEERRFTAQARQLALRCQATSSGRFRAASTADVARDLDLLRQAVGDARLTFAGYSYGTFVGATYARLFPDRVGRLVLDAPFDPVAYTGTGTGGAAATVPLGLRVGDGGAAASRALAEFARLCRDAGPQRCALAALGDPAAVVDATLARLARQPAELPLPEGGSITVTQPLAVSFVYGVLGSPESWPQLADVLAAVAAPGPVPTAVADDVRAARVLGLGYRGADYPSVGGGLASLCLDTAVTGRVGDYPRVAAEADAGARWFGRLLTWADLSCEFWRLSDDDAYRGPWRQVTQAPVLVVGTRFDPVTPYEHAGRFAEHFPAASLLTVDGWSHVSLGRSRCADAAVTAYLLSGATPQPRTRCAPDAGPFPAPTP